MSSSCRGDRSSLLFLTTTWFNSMLYDKSKKETVLKNSPYSAMIIIVLVRLQIFTPESSLNFKMVVK